ncbi:2'-5' RNA ligase family protein [Streptomyces sp. CNQ-509]|uniref:2'-5' RNA ligase family protein n=1 Tax=Streptomyces sp. CNQ-509 TaxID=444103 RepID=UPI00069B4ED7|nr:2'-5' RNA ligase family protein [Streptomyces sp. CNQ-509]
MASIRCLHIRWATQARALIEHARTHWRRATTIRTTYEPGIDDRQDENTEGIMEDFFARVQNREQPWPPGREDLHWHLLPPPPIRRALTDRYRPVAALPGMAAVAPEDVHLTVQHAAPLDGYRPGEIEAIRAGVTERARAMDPVEVVLSRPALGTVALECGGHPGEPARRVWRMVCDVHDKVTSGRFPRISASYDPHVTLAYGDPRELHQMGAFALVA